MPLSTDSGYLPDWLKALLGEGSYSGQAPAGLFSETAASPAPNIGLLSNNPLFTGVRTDAPAFRAGNAPEGPLPDQPPTFTYMNPNSPAFQNGPPAVQGYPSMTMPQDPGPLAIGPAGAVPSFMGVNPNAPFTANGPTEVQGRDPLGRPASMTMPQDSGPFAIGPAGGPAAFAGVNPTAPFMANGPDVVQGPANARDFQATTSAPVNLAPRPNSNVQGTPASGAPEAVAPSAQPKSPGLGDYLGKASDLIGSIYGAGGPGDALIALGLSNRTNGASVQALNSMNANRVAQQNQALKAFDLKNKIQAQNSTYNALVKAGANPETAQAAVDAAAGGNSTMLKALVDQHFAPNEYAVTKDAYGNPIYYNKNNPNEVGKVGGGAVGGADAGLGTAGGLINDQNAHLKGDEFLSTIPPNMAAKAKQIIEGREAWPTGYSARSPQVMVLKDIVTQADPTYDFTNAGARKKTRDQFVSTAPSAPGNVIQTGNTVLGHLGQLSDAADALQNTKAPAWNAITQAFQRATGSSVNLTSFEGLRDRYVEEITRFYRGAGGAERDIEREIAALASTKSPAELQSAIATAADAIKSKIAAVQHTWHAGMGENASDYPIFNQEGIAAMNKLAARDPRKLLTPVDATGKTIQMPEAVPSAPAAAPAMAAAPSAPVVKHLGTWDPVKKRFVQ